MVEYALLLALVTAVVVIGLIAIAPRLNTIFQSVGPGLSPATTSTAVPLVAPTATVRR